MPCSGARTATNVRSRPPISSARRCASTVRAELGIVLRRDPTTCSSGITSRIRGAALEGSSAISGTASTPSNHAEAEGLFLPAGPGDAWGYGYLVDPSARYPELPSRERADRPHQAGRRHPQPAGRDRAARLVLVGGTARRSLPTRPGLPGGRRRAPRHAAGRHRDEHRRARRLRHRVEARVGDERLGEPCAPRLRTSSSGAGRRAQRRPLRRSRRDGPAPRRRSSASTWAAGSRTIA